MVQTPSSPHTQKVCLRTYTLLGGWQVFVGQTDVDNDYLTFRVASTTTRVHSRWVASAIRRLRCERYAAWFLCW